MVVMFSTCFLLYWGGSVRIAVTEVDQHDNDDSDWGDCIMQVSAASVSVTVGGGRNMHVAVS